MIVTGTLSGHRNRCIAPCCSPGNFRRGGGCPQCYSHNISRLLSFSFFSCSSRSPTGLVLAERLDIFSAVHTFSRSRKSFMGGRLLSGTSCSMALSAASVDPLFLMLSGRDISRRDTARGQGLNCSVLDIGLRKDKKRGGSRNIYICCLVEQR